MVDPPDVGRSWSGWGKRAPPQVRWRWHQPGGGRLRRPCHKSRHRDPGEAAETPAAEPEPAAEGFNVEKDFPLIMERNKLKLKGLNEAVNRTNKTIDKINDEVESLLKD